MQEMINFDSQEKIALSFSYDSVKHESQRGYMTEERFQIEQILRETIFVSLEYKYDLAAGILHRILIH